MVAAALTRPVLSGLLWLAPLLACAQRSYNHWPAPSPKSSEPAPARRAATKPAAGPAQPQATSTATPGEPAASIQVQQMPVYPGGNEALDAYLRKHVRRPAGKRLSGRVLVTFTVLQSGEVRGAYVKPGNGLDPRYDAAAVEVISGLRGFQGGKTNGQPSAIEVTYPVVFR